MQIKTVGLITYHHRHLKTEQVLQRLLGKPYTYRMFALPFAPRKPRDVLLQHRPDQSEAVAPETLAAKQRIPYHLCEGDVDIDDGCDIYLILGAGILSPGCLTRKKVVNTHPGIIPASRGLDSFKWAILEGKPLGVTLHYVDQEVDAGEIISVIPTPVYETDTLHTLGRRHYENEIQCMGDFDTYLKRPCNEFADVAAGEAKRRMPRTQEAKLRKAFPRYVATFGR